MTESRMEAMGEQEQRDAVPTPEAEREFEARVVPYSSVVGSSVMLYDPKGPAIGQLALLCFGGKEDQEYWAQRLTRALNNGAKAEKAIAHMLSRGLLKTSREMPEGQGGPVRSQVVPVDVRGFVRGLDKRNQGGNHGAAIRRDEKAPYGGANGAGALPNVRGQAGGASME